MTTGHWPTTVGTSSSPAATTSSMTSRRCGQAGWASRTPRCSRPCLSPLHFGRYDEAFAEAFLAATRAEAAKLRRAYEEGWPYDRDFELLVEPRKDGALDDLGLEAQMGFLNLRFADWFLPFWEDYDPFWVRRR
jgi:hypothetical protein